MSESQASTVRAIVVQRVLPHSPEKIWRVLTESALLDKWLMKNDFKAEIGHRFTFHTKPMGDWDGVVECEVLDCDPPNLLRYSWVGGSKTNDAYGSRLISVLTWTLTPATGGTVLRMEHDGFGSGNEFAYQAMSGGWARILDKINELAAGLE